MFRLYSKGIHKTKSLSPVLKILVILLFSIAHAGAFLKYFSAAERTKFTALMQNTGIIKSEQQRIEKKILEFDSGTGKRLEIMRYLAKGLRRAAGDTLTWDKVDENNNPIDDSGLPPVTTKPDKNAPPPKNLAADFIDTVLNITFYKMVIAEAVCGEREPGPEGQDPANIDYYALINNAMPMKDRIALVNLMKIADGTKIGIIKIILFNIFKNEYDKTNRSKIIQTLYALNSPSLQEDLQTFNVLMATYHDTHYALNALRTKLLTTKVQSTIFDALRPALDAQKFDEILSTLIVADQTMQQTIIANLNKLIAFMPLDNPQHDQLKVNLAELFSKLAQKIPANIDNLINVVDSQLKAKTWPTKQKVIIVQAIADMTVLTRNAIGAHGAKTIPTYRDKPGAELRQAIESLLRKCSDSEGGLQERYAIESDEEEEEEAIMEAEMAANAIKPTPGAIGPVPRRTTVPAAQVKPQKQM